MATDLTTDVQRDIIITNALRRLNVIASAETPSAQAISDAAHALNLIVKRFDSDPKLKMFHNFTVRSVAVSANDTSVLLTAGVLAVEGAYYKKTSDSSVVPLKPTTLQMLIESMAPDSTAATPNYYYVSENGDRASQVTMFFSPKIAAAGTVYYWTREKIDLFDSSTDQSDFPDSWARYLTLQLTADLAWEYGKSLEEIDKHDQLAQAEYEFLMEIQVQNTDYRKTDMPTDNNDRTV